MAIRPPVTQPSTPRYSSFDAWWKASHQPSPKSEPDNEAYLVAREAWNAALSERGDSGARWVPVADEIASNRIQEVAAMIPIYTLHRRQWYRLDGLKEPK